MKTIKTILTAIRSPLQGKLIRLELNGDLFHDNAHAKRVFWTQRVCYVLLR